MCYCSPTPGQVAPPDSDIYNLNDRVPPQNQYKRKHYKKIKINKEMTLIFVLCLELGRVERSFKIEKVSSCIKVVQKIGLQTILIHVLKSLICRFSFSFSSSCSVATIRLLV